MIRFEEEFQRIDPDWVLVYWDNNSTIAAALASVKIDIRVTHLEAGPRSFNRSMPEEHNRILTDDASDLPLSPTAGGKFLLATIHRPYNTDDPQRLERVVKSLAALPLPSCSVHTPSSPTRSSQRGRT